MPEPVDPSSRGTPATPTAASVMETLGYRRVPQRSVPGPLTKAVVVLLCVVAIVAAVWFGRPQTGGPTVPSDLPQQGTTMAVAPDPAASDVTIAPGQIPESATVELRPGDRDLAAERIPDSAPPGMLPEAPLVDAIDLRSGWGTRFDGSDGADWLPGARLAVEPDPRRASAAAAVRVPQFSDELLDRLVVLSVDEVRAGVASDALVGLLGEELDLGQVSAMDGAAPTSPSPIIVRSRRAAAARTEPPLPPPVASIHGPVVGHSPGFAQALRHHEAGDFERARDRYLALIARSDRDGEAHNNLGVLYQEHGYQTEAIRQFQRAIAIDSRYVKAHNNLGVVFLETASLDGAIQEFRLALADDPTNLESMVNLALALEAQGHGADAVETLHDALAVDPTSPEAHYNLALLHDRRGNERLALEHYRSFLRLGSHLHPMLASEVRRRVDRLTSDPPAG